MPNTKEEWDKARTLLGQQVRVVLDYDDDNAIAEGKLLSLCEDGEIVVQDNCGMVHYCWPLLEIEEHHA